MSETKYIILHESVASSWLKDFGSLGSLALLLYVNHEYADGWWVINAIGVWALFNYMVGHAMVLRGGAHRFTKRELHAWALDEGAP